MSSVDRPGPRRSSPVSKALTCGHAAQTDLAEPPQLGPDARVAGVRGTGAERPSALPGPAREQEHLRPRVHARELFAGPRFRVSAVAAARLGNALPAGATVNRAAAGRPSRVPALGPLPPTDWSCSASPGTCPPHTAARAVSAGRPRSAESLRSRSDGRPGSEQAPCWPAHRPRRGGVGELTAVRCEWRLHRAAAARTRPAPETAARATEREFEVRVDQHVHHRHPAHRHRPGDREHGQRTTSTGTQTGVRHIDDEHPCGGDIAAHHPEHAFEPPRKPWRGLEESRRCRAHEAGVLGQQRRADGEVTAHPDEGSAGQGQDPCGDGGSLRHLPSRHRQHTRSSGDEREGRGHHRHPR